MLHFWYPTSPEARTRPDYQQLHESGARGTHQAQWEKKRLVGRGQDSWACAITHTIQGRAPQKRSKRNHTPKDARRRTTRQCSRSNSSRHSTAPITAAILTTSLPGSAITLPESPGDDCVGKGAGWCCCCSDAPASMTLTIALRTVL